MTPVIALRATFGDPSWRPDRSGIDGQIQSELRQLPRKLPGAAGELAEPSPGKRSLIWPQTFRWERTRLTSYAFQPTWQQAALQAHGPALPDQPAPPLRLRLGVCRSRLQARGELVLCAALPPAIAETGEPGCAPGGGGWRCTSGEAIAGPCGAARWRCPIDGLILTPARRAHQPGKHLDACSLRGASSR